MATSSRALVVSNDQRLIDREIAAQSRINEANLLIDNQINLATTVQQNHVAWQDAMKKLKSVYRQKKNRLEQQIERNEQFVAKLIDDMTGIASSVKQFHQNEDPHLKPYKDVLRLVDQVYSTENYKLLSVKRSKLLAKEKWTKTVDIKRRRTNKQMALVKTLERDLIKMDRALVALRRQLRSMEEMEKGDKESRKAIAMSLARKKLKVQAVDEPQDTLYDDSVMEDDDEESDDTMEAEADLDDPVQQEAKLITDTMSELILQLRINEQRLEVERANCLTNIEYHTEMLKRFFESEKNQLSEAAMALGHKKVIVMFDKLKNHPAKVQFEKKNEELRELKKELELAYKSRKRQMMSVVKDELDLYRELMQKYSEAAEAMDRARQHYEDAYGWPQITQQMAQEIFAKFSRDTEDLRLYRPSPNDEGLYVNHCIDRKIEFTKYQLLLAKLLSPRSPYRGFLAYHGVGSGKTLLSILVIVGWILANVRGELDASQMISLVLLPNKNVFTPWIKDFQRYMAQFPIPGVTMTERAIVDGSRMSTHLIHFAIEGTQGFRVYLQEVTQPLAAEAARDMYETGCEHHIPYYDQFVSDITSPKNAVLYQGLREELQRHSNGTDMLYERLLTREHEQWKKEREAGKLTIANLIIKDTNDLDSRGAPRKARAPKSSSRQQVSGFCVPRNGMCFIDEAHNYINSTELATTNYTFSLNAIRWGRLIDATDAIKVLELTGTPVLNEDFVTDFFKLINHVRDRQNKQQPKLPMPAGALFAALSSDDRKDPKNVLLYRLVRAFENRKLTELYFDKVGDTYQWKEGYANLMLQQNVGLVSHVNLKFDQTVYPVLDTSCPTGVVSDEQGACMRKYSEENGQLVAGPWMSNALTSAEKESAKKRDWKRMKLIEVFVPVNQTAAPSIAKKLKEDKSDTTISCNKEINPKCINFAATDSKAGQYKGMSTYAYGKHSANKHRALANHLQEYPSDKHFVFTSVSLFSHGAGPLATSLRDPSVVQPENQYQMIDKCWIDLLICYAIMNDPFFENLRLSGSKLFPQGMALRDAVGRLLDGKLSADSANIVLAVKQFFDREAGNITSHLLESCLRLLNHERQADGKKRFIFFGTGGEERSRYAPSIVASRVAHLRDTVFEQGAGNGIAQNQEYLINPRGLTRFPEELIKSMMLDLFNHPSNDHGESIHFFAMDIAGKEGISLTHVRWAHLLEVPANGTLKEQAIGRVLRNCSHRRFATNEWTVRVLVYVSTFTKPIEGYRFSPDEVLLKQGSSGKQRPLDLIMPIIESAAVDSLLFSHYMGTEDSTQVIAASKAARQDKETGGECFDRHTNHSYRSKEELLSWLADQGQSVPSNAIYRSMERLCKQGGGIFFDSNRYTVLDEVVYRYLLDSLRLTEEDVVQHLDDENYQTQTVTTIYGQSTNKIGELVGSITQWVKGLIATVEKSKSKEQQIKNTGGSPSMVRKEKTKQEQASREILSVIMNNKLREPMNRSLVSSMTKKDQKTLLLSIHQRRQVFMGTHTPAQIQTLHNYAKAIVQEEDAKKRRMHQEVSIQRKLRGIPMLQDEGTEDIAYGHTSYSM